MTITQSSKKNIQNITDDTSVMSSNNRIVRIETFIPFLSSLYQEMHRHYHSLNHILDLECKILDIENFIKSNVKPQFHDELLEDLPNLISTLRAIAWFHDSYYNTYAPPKRNEQISLRLAKEMMDKEEHAGNFNYINKFDILEGILATAEHMQELTDQVNNTTKLFLDLDMFGFSLPEDEYNSNTVDIRKEYFKTSDKDFLAGRQKFLTALLSKSKIYYLLNSEFESKARYNIEKELLRINTGGLASSYLQLHTPYPIVKL